MYILNFDYRLSNLLGYGVGCILAFFLNKSWVFEYSGSHLASAVRWGLVVGVCYAMNLTAVIFLHERLGIDASLAQLGGVAVYTASSFLGGRLFAFRERRVPRSKNST